MKESYHNIPALLWDEEQEGGGELKQYKVTLHHENAG
jgi:hypothetical protein